MASCLFPVVKYINITSNGMGVRNASCCYSALVKLPPPAPTWFLDSDSTPASQIRFLHIQQVGGERRRASCFLHAPAAAGASAGGRRAGSAPGGTRLPFAGSAHPHVTGAAPGGAPPRTGKPRKSYLKFAADCFRSRYVVRTLHEHLSTSSVRFI